VATSNAENVYWTLHPRLGGGVVLVINIGIHISILEKVVKTHLRYFSLLILVLREVISDKGSIDLNLSLQAAGLDLILGKILRRSGGG
jgi:hypothetical protein